MCRLVLGHAEPSDSLAPQIYEVVAYRLSHDDPYDRRALVSILSYECRRVRRIPEAMVAVLDRLKATSDDTRRLICARHEFLACATSGEQQEFLQLLSTNNDILDVNVVGEISSLTWPEATQEQLWHCVLTRLLSEDGSSWWRRTSIAQTLTTWARTPDQRIQIMDRLAELLIRLASDSTALHAGRGNLLSGKKAELPDSGLDTNLGKFVLFVRGRGLPEAVLRDAHEALAERAAVAATLRERAALLECAGALLPDEAKTAADTERALALLHAARTTDDGAEPASTPAVLADDPGSRRHRDMARTTKLRPAEEGAAGCLRIRLVLLSAAPHG